MAGDSLMGPPSLFHRSVVQVRREDGTFIIDLTGALYVHTDPSQCSDWCPPGWLLAYPGAEVTQYAADVEAFCGCGSRKRDITAPETGKIMSQMRVTKLPGPTAYVCDACEHLYFFMDEAIACRDSHLNLGEHSKADGRRAPWCVAQGCGGEHETEEQHAAWVMQNSRVEGARGFDLPGASALSDPRGDAGSSPAASTGESGFGIAVAQTSERRVANPEDVGNQSPTGDYSERQRTPGSPKPGEWGCGVCEWGQFGGRCATCGRDAALERSSDVGPGETGSQLGGVTPAPVPGRGGSGIVIGSQHGRDCVDESCRTPVPGRHALGEAEHDPFAAFQRAVLNELYLEDERDAFFFGA